MADVSITFTNATTAETRAATWALAQANAARAVQNPPLPPFATVKLFLEANLQERLLSWIKAEAEANVSQANIKARWDLATDAQRTAALAQLPPAP
jgi:hypothetical protein